jgi:hypothetical protein
MELVQVESSRGFESVCDNEHVREQMRNARDEILGLL